MSSRDPQGLASHHHRIGSSNRNHRGSHGVHAGVLTRPSWFDARIALGQIERGKVDGNRSAICLRAKIQDYCFDVGCFVQRNAGKVLFVGLLALVTFCVALKSTVMETGVEKLWVEEDGRLENELNYMEKTLGEGYGSSNQLIIQTPKTSDSNILHPSALLHHLEVMKAATEVTVDLFEVTWRMKDLCYSPSVPLFEEVYIDKILEDLFPCAIITPLDCFWEGSKILGPEYPITVPGLPSLNLKWTHLNPERMIDLMREMNSNNHKSSHMSYMAFLEIMHRAGISTAYQEKPCLNFSDPACPSTAPNKITQLSPDVGRELTGGCYGFATKLMHWPEDLIVGGATKNKSGRILKAKALQSIVQLMADQEMFDYWTGHYKVHNIEWSLDKAKQVLEAWQRKFAEEVQKFNGNGEHARNLPPQLRGFRLHLFTSTSLMDIMKNFSSVNLYKVGASVALLIVYVCLVFTKCDSSVKSMRFISVAGVLLVAISVAAGLGLCALLRLPFNASTTQVLPFITLGLGMYQLFQMTFTYAQNVELEHQFEDINGECLKQIGPVILLTSIATASGFLSAYIIPLPALRAFVLQAAVIITFITLTMLFLFPAIASLDLRRRRSRRVDLLCCLTAKPDDEDREQPARRATEDNVQQLNDLSRERNSNKYPAVVHFPSSSSAKLNNFTGNLLTKQADAKVCEPFLPPKRYDKVGSGGSGITCPEADIGVNMNPRKYKFSEKFSLSFFVKTIYGPLLEREAFKGFVILLFTTLLLGCLSGVPLVRDGLQLTDIVPRQTVEHEFLDLQREYFNFFNMFAVTQGNFEYPTNQKLLLEYYHSFTRIDKIIKNDDGGLPDFWLTMFRDWLVNLQQIFDKEFIEGLITQEGWSNNASDDAILAYKLLVQTGRVDNPVDKSLVTKVKLVDSAGIINPKAFYNYLTAWVSNDALAYSSSQASFKPDPKQWTHVARDYELKIPKSQPLKYAQIPFYLNKMNSTEEITAAIEEIRTICQKYEERGLPNFPTGVPFVFWEQYIRLPIYLLFALVIVVAAVFLIICIFLFNPQTALLLVVLLVLVVAQLYGLMGHFGITMSAVPTVILIFSVGIQCNIFLPITLSFLTALGTRNRRASIALEQMFSPLVHGILSTLFGIGMLSFSEFDFITRYFSFILCGLTALGSLYGLVLLPVLLSIFGSPSEIVPFENSDRMLPPTPPPSSPIQRRSSRGGSSPGGSVRCSLGRPGKPRSHSESDEYLSTIYEESQSCRSSHEIISVQPELVVETTTITNGGGQYGCSSSTYTTSSNVHPTASSPSGSLPEKLIVESPILTSDRDTPDTPLSRDSPASMSDSSSGMSSMSRPSSAPVPGYHHQVPQTVTTKVKATAKLTFELHGAAFRAAADQWDYSSSSSSTNSGSQGSGRRASKEKMDHHRSGSGGSSSRNRP